MKKRSFYAWFAVASVWWASIVGSVAVMADAFMTARPEMKAVTTPYVANRAPLSPVSFIKLPTGTVKPQGWILTQLNLQADGLCGHLGEISAWLQKEDNAWLTAGGKWGWEEVPYWLRGYSSMAWLLGRSDMQKESKSWIEAILKSQKGDGNFGPSSRNVKDAQDFWPNMVVLWLLQDYYEYSGDKRVIDFMTRYFHFELTVPDSKFLRSYWENSRGGDNLWSVVWLYNRTGDSLLLRLADKIHRCTADWTQESSLPNWHNVNIAQCVREPAEYFLFKKDSALLRASYNDQQLIRRTFGQVPGGMFGADENARLGYIDPRQGTETCGFAEQMATDEILTLITGDPYWAENCEDIAFNSFPAAFTADYKALRYFTSPNMVVSDDKNHSPGIENAGPFFLMNPFSSRCCQHNHGFGWPYYSEHLLMATPDAGLAAVLYGACEAKVKVGQRANEVTLTEVTDYPFDSQISFVLTTGKKVSFPLYLRIPRWTDGATVTVNGEAVGCNIEQGKYMKINREWSNGDRVVLNFPMTISFRHWQVNHNSVSVDYGPLTLSLYIKEKMVKRADSVRSVTADSKWQKDTDTAKWPIWLIYPESDWNYALCADEPVALVKKQSIKNGENPFTQASSPLIFKARARKVPDWKLDRYGLCAPLPCEKAPRSHEEYDVLLIPMGAARLRISAFPQGNQ